MRALLIALPLLLTATVAAKASSDEAWAELNRTVTARCAKASQLKSPQLSDPVQFDDTLGKVAVLVRGVFPQKAMKGARGSMLCIYDKASGKVWIDEAPGWSVSTK
ncbi:hypothetical protein ACLE20_13710 [Rhizobium sp. YIM 134829]|uniref:hypothetical protein n=1 Tax=Rhizobium sp. YIM 134829 TaxID=3390453 RepID=UPI00397DDA24